MVKPPSTSQNTLLSPVPRAEEQSFELSLRPKNLRQYIGQNKVKEDVAKVATNLGGGACRLGYVIVFAECDYGLGDTFVADTEASSGCRVRFIRGW